MGRILEPWVEQQFLDALGPDGPLAEAMTDTTAIDEAVRQLEEAEHELASYNRDARLRRALGADEFAAGIEVRAQAVDAARAEVARAREQSALAQAIALTSGNLAEAWPTLSIPERRRLLTAAIDSVFIRAVRGSTNRSVADRALILWRGTAPTDLPRRGLRVPLAPFTWPDDRPADLRMPIAQHT
jgi:hypothetical protein